MHAKQHYDFTQHVQCVLLLLVLAGLNSTLLRYLHSYTLLL